MDKTLLIQLFCIEMLTKMFRMDWEQREVVKLLKERFLESAK